jgi:hypothetical protein
MKLLPRTVIAFVLAASFLGAGFAMSHNMVGGNAVCTTHCATFSTPLVTSAAPATRDFLALLALVALLISWLLVPRKAHSRRPLHRTTLARPPTPLYRINMTYTGYLV